MRHLLPRRAGARFAALLAVFAAFALATAGPANANPLDNEHRTLTNWADGYCLYESSTSPSVVATSSNTSCDSGSYYTWKGNSDYTIRNTATGFCLTGSSGSTVTAGLCSGSAYQKWSWVQDSRGPNVLLFHNLGNNLYLDHGKFGGTVFTSAGTDTETQAWFQCITGCTPLPL